MDSIGVDAFASGCCGKLDDTLAIRNGSQFYRGFSMSILSKFYRSLFKKQKKTIFCIGDSHVCFFSGLNRIQPAWPQLSIDILERFRTFHIGAVLAYNLCKEQTSEMGRETLFKILDLHIPKKSHVMLCFGEIDCRNHLLRQADLQKKSIESIVEECAHRYCLVISEIINLDYMPIVYNAIPSSWVSDVNNPSYPVYGSCSERNRATKRFNGYMAEFCKRNKIGFLSNFKYLVDKDGLTNKKYYMDAIHLSQRAMPLTLKALRSVKHI